MTYVNADDFIAFDFGSEASDEAEEPRGAVLARPVASRATAVSLMHKPVAGISIRGASVSTGASGRKRTFDKVEPPPPNNYYGDNLTCVFDRYRANLPPWFAAHLTEARDTPPAPILARNVHQLLHQEVLDFVDFISPTAQEHRVRELVIQRVRRMVQSHWPDASVDVFGSFTPRIYLPDGDIDLVITLRQAQSKSAVVQCLRTLTRVLRQDRLARNIILISNARVPIIKFVDRPTGLNVDVSCNMDNGIKVVGLVTRYLESDWPVTLRALVLVVKQFLSQRGLSEVHTGGLGSYAVINMVVSFLQLHPKIQSGAIDPRHNLGVLLLEFFELYGLTFNYRTTGIRIAHPSGYFSKATSPIGNTQPPHLLCIQDPQDASNNISRGTYGINRVQAAFAGAFTTLTKQMTRYRQRLAADGSLGRVQRRGWHESNQISASELSADDRAQLADSGRSAQPDDDHTDDQVLRTPFVASFLASVLQFSPGSLQRRQAIGQALNSRDMQRERQSCANDDALRPRRSKSPPRHRKRSASPVKSATRSPPKRQMTTLATGPTAYNHLTKAMARRPVHTFSEATMNVIDISSDHESDVVVVEPADRQTTRPGTPPDTQTQLETTATTIVTTTGDADEDSKTRLFVRRDTRRDFWQAKAQARVATDTDEDSVLSGEEPMTPESAATLFFSPSEHV
ncbi:hypothetical protein IWQ60_010002 [Tieghemiomyces parasiticus]|uniref:polynucleotide adenylyltransferase n=1 Tax=Tieghemiomyces parasiticus TaxID=78921 RepID=A0A9W7ZUA8_9FUNG|nr:hypothetical protein IWQ60_010002 [Tieghemiomyces parasiticus]